MDYKQAIIDLMKQMVLADAKEYYNTLGTDLPQEEIEKFMRVSDKELYEELVKLMEADRKK